MASDASSGPSHRGHSWGNGKEHQVEKKGKKPVEKSGNERRKQEKEKSVFDAKGANVGTQSGGDKHSPYLDFDPPPLPSSLAIHRHYHHLLSIVAVSSLPSFLLLILFFFFSRNHNLRSISTTATNPNLSILSSSSSFCFFISLSLLLRGSLFLFFFICNSRRIAIDIAMDCDGKVGQQGWWLLMDHDGNGALVREKE
ncbi:hypothetical protein LOK49_LG14G00344 [Camellia lanceoleosa]|uniref:Uncharacterized protein n=1 Tax=Camellia lanceoleosa TaxID=1840588 RepID=A0ACC0FF54_9ERIC|nr:hypothetical protein LOK49_LG14G00344 [Camellia lanceoleosa]